MQPASTLMDFISTWEVALFLGLPLVLLTAVLVEQWIEIPRRAS